MNTSSSGEWKEAIETDHDGAIFVSKQPATPPRQSRNSKEGDDDGALACCDSLALAGAGGDMDTESNHSDADHDPDVSVVSLELLTVVNDDDLEKTTRLQKLCGKRLIGCWVCGLLFVILATVLPLTLKKDKNRDMGDVSVGSGSDGIHFVSDQSIAANVYDILEPIVSNPEALLDPSTPEGQAFLDVESNGEQNPFDIQQQYALQMLYYSTGGGAWVFNHGWRSYSEKQRKIRTRRRRSMIDSSLCGWAGIAICRNLGEGRYAVAGLDLGTWILSKPIQLCWSCCRFIYLTPWIFCSTCFRFQQFARIASGRLVSTDTVREFACRKQSTGRNHSFVSRLRDISHHVGSRGQRKFG